MDLNSNEVSRLLEYAAAMSSAQEKVTGNAKLDMAGIMAALAMARSDTTGPDTRVGQHSFLHNKFLATETDDIKIKTGIQSNVNTFKSDINSDINSGKSSSRIGTKSSSNFMKTESKTEINNFKKETINDVKTTKNEFKSNIKSMIENKFNTNDLKTNKNESKVKDIKEDQLFRAERVDLKLSEDLSNSEKRENIKTVKTVTINNTDNVKADIKKGYIKDGNDEAGLYENVIPKPKNMETTEVPPALPPRNPITNNVFGNKFHISKAAIANKTFEEKNNSASMNDHQTDCSILSTSSWNSSRSQEQDVMKKVEDDDSVKNHNHPQVSTLKSSLGVARYIKESQNHHQESSKQNTENVTKITKPISQAKKMFENITNVKTQEATTATQSTIQKKSVEEDPESMSQFLAIVEKLSEEKEMKTGNGRLDMSELVAALNNFQEADSGKISDNFKVQHNPCSRSSPPPPPPPQFQSHPLLVNNKIHEKQKQEVQDNSKHAKSAQMEPTRNHVNNAKSSFLKSTLTHATKAGEAGNKQETETFTTEKNDLLGELKSRLNNDPDSVPINSNNSRSRQFSTVTNPDQAVKKIVYSQYRELLNSYKSNK